MPRKNIFEIVADIFDLPQELTRMKRLFEKKELTFCLMWVGIYIVSFSRVDFSMEKL